MDDESKIETNEYNSNMNTENKNVEKSGNWVSKQSTPVKAILGIAAVCCIGLIVLLAIGIMTPGGINWEFNTNTSDKFTNEVSIAGVTFYLPDGFKLIKTNSYSTYETFSYSDGTNGISMSVYPSASKAEVLSVLKSSTKFTNINEDASYGGYSGYTADFDINSSLPEKVFIFEKSGKIFLIEMNEELNFDEYVPKIIG